MTSTRRTSIYLETIDADLRLVVGARHVALYMTGCTLSMVRIDRLLDERRLAESSASYQRSRWFTTHDNVGGDQD